jgi:hypothetical protein
MLRCFFFVFFTFCWFISSSFAYAKEKINTETAAYLKSLFQSALNEQKNLFNIDGHELLIEGDTLVEEAEFYYAVTLPELSIKTQQGATIKIGIIAINVMPTDKQNVWKMTVALPTPISIFLSSNKNSSPLNIYFGSQSFIGLWDESIKTFSKFDAKYQNINIKNALSSIDLEIPEITATLNLEENEKEYWSGAFVFNANGLNLTAEDNSSGKIENIKIRADIDDYDFKTAYEYKDQLNALAESYTTTSEPSMSPEHITSIYDLITNAIGNVGDGFSLHLTINGMEFKSAEDKEGMFSIKKAGFGTFMNGFKENDLSIGTRIHYDGLSITPPPALYKNIFPSDVNLDFSINHLPYLELVELGKNTLKSTLNSNSLSRISALQALILAPQLMTEAGTNLQITKSFLSSDGYKIDIGGVAIANLQAVKGGTAKARMDILGADTLLSYFSENINNPELEEDEREKIEKNMMSLEMLKTMGVQTKNEEGKFVLRYDLELDEKGNLLLNGRDLLQSLNDNK